MKPFDIDIAGLKHNRLTGINTLPRTRGKRLGVFECICGIQKILPITVVTTGKQKSCGCLRADAQRKHNGVKTRAYSSWSGMIDRCENKKAKAWPRYGGRGIKVCRKWRRSFAAFFSDMGERPVRWTLERINNNLGYSKGNCRWATYAEQNRNTRQNVIISFCGKTMVVSEWAREMSINAGTLRSRLKKMSAAEALTLKIGTRPSRYNV